LPATAPPKAGTAPSLKESIWDGPFPHTGTAETGHQTARVRRYVAGVG